MASGTKIAVLGIWHLGAIYSAGLASFGYQVVGVDSDRARVENLNRGVPPLFEPGLPELLIQGINAGNLAYTTEVQAALSGAPYVLMAHDTPVDDQDGVDLSGLWATVQDMAPYLEPDAIVVISSQVPVGTCGEVKALIQRSCPGLKFDVAYAPENLRLGQALQVFRNMDLLVIGADSSTTGERVEALFQPLGAPVLKMDLRSAEMTKHAVNTFLAMCISYINELANLCDEVGANALQVASAIKRDKRIGPGAPLSPGLGFAGGTLARDLVSLQVLGDRYGLETYLIDAILRVNQLQNRAVVHKLEKALGTLRGRTVAVLGLTYKPGTSTLRRSCAIDIIREMAARGARVRAYDPQADREEVQAHSEFTFCPDPYAAAQGSEALAIITDWPEFKGLDFGRVKLVMKKPVILDARNMLDGDKLSGQGFLYLGIGRGHTG